MVMFMSGRFGSAGALRCAVSRQSHMSQSRGEEEEREQRQRARFGALYLSSSRTRT